MANEVTSGTELNSYQGNANLADGGQNVGYAPLDLTPLNLYALKKYETNVRDFEQQQKDKQALHDEYSDPNLYLFLDQNFANQVNPKLDELKELSKKNLQLDPNGKDWYRFHNLYNEILQDNAGLKTVQNLKDKYKKISESSADIHEKERIDGYVKQLDGYKLGEEIPSYNKYFGPDIKHLPDLKEESGTMFRIGGSKDLPTEQKVKYTIYNPIDAFPLAQRKVLEDPKALQTGSDFAHTFLEMGGVEQVNDEAKQAYGKALTLNIGLLQDKYAKDFEAYKKTNPTANFRDYMNSTGKSNELQNVYDRLKPFNDGLSVIPIASDNGQPLSGYTYFTDANGNQSRLNLSDEQMLGFMAGTRKPIGRREEIVEEKISKTPAEIALLNAKANKTLSDAKVNRGKLAEQRRLNNVKIAKLKEGTEADTYFSELWDRNPQEQKTLATIDYGNTVTSQIPAESSLPVYTIKSGKVEELRPKGATPIYNKKPDEDGNYPADAKIIGYQGGKYDLRYVNKNNNPISDQALVNAYKENIKQFGEISFDEFLKGAVKAGTVDYVMEGENGIVDRKLALAAQKLVSNKSQRKDQSGIFDDSEDLTIPTDEN